MMHSITGPSSHIIQRSMRAVEKILSNTRAPRIASPDQPHSYDDKFALAEFITALNITALLNALDKLGMERNTLQRLGKVAADEEKTVSLRFAAKEKCEFLKEEEIKIESSTSLVEEKITSDHSTEKTERKIVTKVKQYHWKVDIEYLIYAFCGNDSDPDGTNSVVLQSKTVSCEVVARGEKRAPLSLPEFRLDPKDVSLTWILQHINLDIEGEQYTNADFSVNRDLESCRTPKYNQDIEKASEAFVQLKDWCSGVSAFLRFKDTQILQVMDPSNRPNLNTVHDKVVRDGHGIFVPIIPIFEVNNDLSNTMDSNSSSSPLLSAEDIKLFLEEQSRTMSEQLNSISSQFQDNSSDLMTSTEATIVLLLSHMECALTMWLDGIDHIEQMLYSQLHAAIGKEVDSKDFNEFVRFHNQQLFSDTFAPEEFCYAIRRPEHYPDGIISIEEKDSDDNILTFTRKLENNREYPLYIPINSATSIEFKGDMYMHAWMLQRFQEKPSFQLAARARQFSSFMLLIGKLAGPDTFEPEHGIILQNKDEVMIPLLLNEMPSAKEFNDAIESLSPEQQRFAKSFRNMKLSSSVFGVCIVQLKPQLELLLDLPEKSLTKEISLMQDLLSLFIDYQIPSDLLSFDGPDDLPSEERMKIVKEHVKKVMEIIKSTKEKELGESKDTAKMSVFEATNANTPVVDFGFGAPVSGCLFGSAAPPSSPFSALAAPAPAPAPVFRACQPAAPIPPAPVQEANPFPRYRHSESDASNTDNESSIEILNKDDMIPIGEKKKTIVSDFNLDNVRVDLTAMPKELDKQFEKFSKDEIYGGSLRSITIKTESTWGKKSKLNLLSKMKETQITAKDQNNEKNRAFDLLDALSKSGALPVCDAELHIIIASSHCFEKSVVDTVVRDNVNPIEKIECSNLLVAQVVHGVGVKALLRDESEIERVGKASPLLLTD